MAVTAKAEIQQQLEWERVWRPRGAIVAIVSTLLFILGTFLTASNIGDQPPAPLLESLTKVEAAGPIGDQPSTRAALFEYADDNAATQIGASLAIGLGALLAALALWILMKATAAREARFPAWARYLPIGGGILYGLGQVGVGIGNISYAGDVVATDGTVRAVLDLNEPTIYIAGAVLYQLGMMIVALAFILVSLNAMRSGLLPRTWGIVGIFVGAASILPLGFSQLLQPIFLIALTLIFAGKYPRLAMPAWETGIAVPWPSAADEAARKRDERDAKKGIVREPDPEPVERTATSRPHSATSKKRKRRKP